MTQQEFIKLFERAKKIAYYAMTKFYGPGAYLYGLSPQGDLVVATCNISLPGCGHESERFAFDLDLAFQEDWKEAADAFVTRVLQEEAETERRKKEANEERQREKDLAEYRKLQDKLFPNT